MEFIGAYMYIVLSARHGLSACKCAAGKLGTSDDDGCHIEHLGDYLQICQKMGRKMLAL